MDEQELIAVSPEHWKELAKMDFTELGERTPLTVESPERLRMKFLNTDITVDVGERCVGMLRNNLWERSEDLLLELVVVVYLLNVSRCGVIGEMISVKDLKDAHFFQGPHEFEKALLLERFGNDPEGFARAAEKLGGSPLDMGDAACRLLPFAKIPLYYLLWRGDDEFEPEISILFDKSIETHLPADGIWGLINYVSDVLGRVDACGRKTCTN